MWTNGSSSELQPRIEAPLLGTNSSSDPPLDPPLVLVRAVLVGLVLGSFILFAIVGNILVILAVVCNRNLRTPTNYFIINLALADLLLGSTVLPVSASLEVSKRTTTTSLKHFKYYIKYKYIKKTN